MKVAVDATALASGRGGDETYLRGVLRGLALAAGSADSFDLFCREGGMGTPAEIGERLGERVRWHRLQPSGAGRLITSLPRAWRTSLADVGLAYTHAPVPAPVPYALVVTDLSFRHHPDHYPRRARVRLNTLVPRQARRARVVVTLSEFCRHDLIDSYGLDPERVVVVPCAIDPPYRGPVVDDSWLRHRGIDRPYVLYLGNLHPRKNVARLIEAFGRVAAARSGDVQLVVAGASWWSGGGEDEAAAAAPEGSIVQLGRVNDGERDLLLRRAVTLAYPSLFEGFGLPPIEAMQVGTAVLTSSTTALPETVADAAIQVDPINVESITEGLETILGSDEVRAGLIAAGYRRVEHFCVERTGAAMYQALRGVVA